MTAATIAFLIAMCVCLGGILVTSTMYTRYAAAARNTDLGDRAGFDAQHKTATKWLNSTGVFTVAFAVSMVAALTFAALGHL